MPDMRPLDRGPAPNAYTAYKAAKQDLVNRFGTYCCYCERRIATCLAVEHIQPQSRFADLKNDWHNFLLACVNCNSAKLAQALAFDQVLLPDRDNTFAAFSYAENDMDRHGLPMVWRMLRHCRISVFINAW